MRKLFVLIMLFYISLSVVSYADTMRPKSIDTVMNEIRQEQGLKSGDKINPDKVSQEKLEELGDSVMEAMIGNPELHDQMDNNMGGDGSASLAAMHRRIGYNYLAGYPNGMMNFKSRGMMGYNRYGMMDSFSWVGMIMGILFLILLVGVLFLLIKAYRWTGTKFTTDTPLDILKKRYAKGEISKDEFDKMKHNLNE